MDCPLMYRSTAAGSLHCKAQTSRREEKKDYCAHQYYCPQTRRWENTQAAQKCAIKFTNHSEENKE